MPKLLTEFVGTLFLVLIIGCTAGDFAPLAIGLGLACLVYMGGPISGAHYNPAVTTAALLLRKITPRDGVFYILAQVTGAIAGASLAYVVTRQSFMPAPGPVAPVYAVLAAEILFTFMLVLVVLNVAAVKKVEGNSYYGLAIGLTVTAGAYAVGRTSGAAFNPAVGIGPTIVHAILADGSFKHVWYYILGPIIGAAAAAGVFRLQHNPSPAIEE